LCWVQGGGGQAVEGEPVQVCLAFVVDQAGAGEVVDGDHIGQHAFGGGGAEAEDGERAGVDGLGAGQGEHLHGHGRVPAGEVGELVVLDLGVAGWAAQDGLVQHGGDGGWGVAVQELLAGHGDGGPAGGLLWGDGFDVAQAVGQVAGVGRGLQQRGDEVGLPDEDGGGGVFEADELPLGGGDVGGVVVPPAGVAGRLGQGEQVAVLGAGDLVVAQELVDLGGDRDGLGSFVPADLRR
jgi:hypothetical protein